MRGAARATPGAQQRPRAAAGLLLLLAFGLACSTPAPPAKVRPAATSAFRIEVVDAETGRGIPAVELSASNARSWITDSAGVAAVREPGLMGQDVFFRVRSFGYTHEGKQPDLPGTRLRVQSGRSARLTMRRDNVAQRLYRVTGIQPYRDSVIVGDDPPLRPRLRAQLPTGQDSALAVPHRGRLFWVWGDTLQLSLPYGILRTTAATSALPGRPGVDPEIGIELRYFTDRLTLRPMVDDPHPVIWLSALRSVPDADGEDKLFATYRKIEAPILTVERGLAAYDDADRKFRLVEAYPPDARLVPDGHVFRYQEDGVPYLQYDLDVRSADHADAVRDFQSYEAFTPARPGAILSEGAAVLDRDAAGRLRWGWKRDAPQIPQESWQQLEAAGAVTPEERPFRLLDVDTGETIVPHHGSIQWNEHRQRWIMIRGQLGGPSSQLGEVYYFEGDTPLGPWAYGRKILTHSRPVVKPLDPDARETYSFYNPMQHPEFDQDGGREIFFEGTLSQIFANPPAARIPDYDYNQIMYKLELDDARLFLPVPVYRTPGDAAPYGTLRHVLAGAGPRRWPTRLPAEIAFFAPDRSRAGTVPVRMDPATARLVLDPEATPDAARFHCAPGDPPPPATVPLYEQTDARGSWTYGTEPSAAAGVLCHVWPAPVDYGASLLGHTDRSSGPI